MPKGRLPFSPTGYPVDPIAFNLAWLGDVDVSSSPPADGDTLVWVDADKKWEPGASTPALEWDYDEFTVAGSPVSTYRLTKVPSTKSPHVARQGVVMREGTDYTVNYLTGILTWLGSQSGGDIIQARYQTDGTTTPAPGPITYMGGSTASSTGAGNSSSGGHITLPTWTPDNDYIFLTVNADDSAATLATPAGFTPLLGPTVASSGVGPKMWVFYRVAVTADSGASVTLSLGGTINEWSAVSRVYNGATTFDAQAIQGNGSSGSTTIALPSLTLGNSGDVEVAFYAFVTTNGSATILTPTGYAHFVSVSDTVSPFVATGSGDVTASGTTDNPNNAGCTVAVTSVAAKIALIT